MKKFVFYVKGNPKVLEISRQGEGLYRAKVNDREYNLKVTPVERDIFLLEVDGRIFDSFIYENRNGYVVFLNGKTFEIELAGATPLRRESLEKIGRAEVKARMPGRVKKILANVGDTIKKDTGVITIEAMKMENEIKSPKDGILKELNVKEGMTVEVGTTLFVIE